MFKKQLLEQVLNNKLYKALALKLPQEQRELIEKRLEVIAGDYSNTILDKFSEVTQGKDAKKAFEEILNNQTVINEKTGKPVDKK
jgi:hypothetical protein